MTQEEEDKVLAEGMLLIRNGILSNKLEDISNGYNLITGEEIAFPSVATRSKLERLKQAITAASVDPKDNNEPVENIAVAEKIEKPKKTKKKKTSESDEEDVTAIVTKQAGGKRFATDGIEVISTEIDEEEVKKNKLAAKKTMNMKPAQRGNPPKDNSNDENRDVGYHDKPAIAAPWH